MKKPFSRIITLLFPLVLCFLIVLPCFSQSPDPGLITLDFRNQRISDILLALAAVSGQSVIVDDTVTGNATFRFADADFVSALNRFAEYTNLYVEKKNNMWQVTKVKITAAEKPETYDVDAEDVPIEPLIKLLSRASQKTILYDQLPSGLVTVRTQGASVEEILRLLLLKYADYTLVIEQGGFYVTRNSSRSQEPRSSNTINLDVAGDLYTLSVQKTTLTSLTDALFKKAKKEYSLLNKTSVALDNLYYEGKTFDQLLKLVLEQANSDYTLENGIYYIFEIQKKDVLKKFKTTAAVKLLHVSVADILNLFPAEMNAAAFTRTDKNTNTMYITGSEDEIQPIIDFLAKIDVPVDGRYYTYFELKQIAVKEAAAVIPKTLYFSDIVLIPETNSFVAQVTAEKEKELRSYLELIDKKDRSYPVRLRYIHSEELMKHLPPSVNKEQVALSSDTSLVFFTGPQEKYARFLKDLELIDVPKQQIRYQILVIQYQKTDSFNWKSGISIGKTDETPYSAISSTFSNLLNISFDVVSKFGLFFAADLNAELGENRAKVLADTTLNSISGGDVKFQNTNTFRYRDVAIDAQSGLYTGTTREISSGLTLKINGWVSGDNMITVNVEAQVSKQGEASKDKDGAIENPPPTSEKSVTTHVRTKSGSPVIIGGLLQNEQDSTVKKTPGLGSIPVAGNLFKNQVSSDATTEMVIYLVPFVERSVSTTADFDKKIRSYCQRYLGAN